MLSKVKSPNDTVQKITVWVLCSVITTTNQQQFLQHYETPCFPYLTTAKTFPPEHQIIYVVVNFLSQVIFLFLLFLGMIMYANDV